MSRFIPLQKKFTLASFVNHLILKEYISNDGLIRKQKLRDEFFTWTRDSQVYSIHISEIGLYLLASQFITASKRVGRFEFIQKHFQPWRSNSPSSGSLESLVSTGSELSLNSIGFSSCSDIVSVTTDSNSDYSASTEDTKPDIQTPVDKFVNIAKEGRVHSSLDDLFSNLMIKIDKLIETTSQNEEPILKHVQTVKRPQDSEFIFTSTTCLLCKQHFETEEAFKTHFLLHENQSLVHFTGSITIPHFKLAFNVSSDSSSINFTIRNICSRTLIINHIFLYNPNIVFQLNTIDWPAKIDVEESVTFFVNKDLFPKFNHQYVIFVNFNVLQWNLTEQHNFYIGKSLPVTKIVSSESRFQFSSIIPRETLRLQGLKTYEPGNTIKTLFKNNFLTTNTIDEWVMCYKMKSFEEKNVIDRLNETNYTDMLSYMIELEDLTGEKEMEQFDKTDQLFSFRRGFIVLAMENLEESRPSVMERDLLWVLSMKYADTKENEKFRIHGTILRVEKEFIVIRFDAKKTKLLVKMTQKYRIHFILNRLTTQLQHQAIEMIRDQEISKFFFPQTVSEKSFKEIELEWFNPNIGNNPEQEQAVKNIVSGTAFPAPYILFGPPGTGKTMTIVESVCQLWKINSNANILISTATNASCNEIATRLLKYLPHDELFRLFASNLQKNMDKIDTNLIKISNLAGSNHFYPAFSTLFKYRILLTTLTVAGRLVQGGIANDHYTHVFIDECGSASEPAALIPIVGIITGHKELTGNIVLAGDPKQLGPIIKSSKAEALGLGMSLLERLMNLPIYQKNQDTHKYNSIVITKLIRNFRSHNKILTLPSKMFYENELIAAASEEETSLALNWCKLPRRDFPIIFKSVYGRPCQDNNSPSWFNQSEIDMVMQYVRDIMIVGINSVKIEQGDIGIISPYKKQCIKIRFELTKLDWDKIQVGSVEQFQGQEKKIIILSTVRSNMKSIGFLDNPKRFNVSLTRAKSLLIIVGDANMLKKDKHWCQLVKYCSDNNSLIGAVFRHY